MKPTYSQALVPLLLLFIVQPTTPAFPDFIAIPDSNLIPEGIAWDAARSRFIFGSIGQGKVSFLRESDVTTSEDPMSGVADIQTLTPADELLVPRTIGLAVDADNDRLWVCQRSVSLSSEVQGAVAALNLTNGAVILNADVTSMQIPGRRMFMNDVITDEDGNAYSTDSYNNHIIRITPGSEVTRFATSEDWAGPANQIVLNGIEYVNGALLAGARPRPGLAELYRVPLNNPQGMAKVEITNGNLTSLDGLMFDDEKDFLYVVSRPTFFAGTIVVLASTDGWRTAQVMTKTDVPRTCRTPTTAAFVASGDNRGLWVICSNGFGPQGPYAIQKVDAPIAKIVRTTPMEIIFPALLNPLGARRA